MSRLFFHDPPVVPHPVLNPERYCRVETFKAGKKEVIALAWTGDPDADWSAKWAFMVARSGTFFQVESPVAARSIPAPRAALGIRRAVALTWSEERRITILHAFTDWPPYGEVKALVASAMAKLPPPIVALRAPPQSIDLWINPDRLAEPPGSGQ